MATEVVEGTTSALVHLGGELVDPETAGRNPALVYLSRLAPSGRRTMASTLRKIAELGGYVDLAVMPWASLGYAEVTAIASHLSTLYEPATVNKYLCAIRGVMRAAWRLGLVDAERYQHITDVENVKGQALPAGRAVAQGELLAVMRACKEDPTPAGARDAAIIALGYGCGLRRGELAGLQLGAVTREGAELYTIRLTGKRKRERLCYVDGGAARALEAWLAVRGEGEGPLFYRGHKGGRIDAGESLSAQGVRNIVVKRMAQVGAAWATPHDLRRSFVSDLLDAGVDIATVASMAGHASVQTTARYDRRGEATRRKAAKALHVPY